MRDLVLLTTVITLAMAMLLLALASFNSSKNRKSETGFRVAAVLLGLATLIFGSAYFGII